LEQAYGPALFLKHKKDAIPPMSSEEVNVLHDSNASRFCIETDHHTAVLDYRKHGDTILFLHTGVPPALEGRGIGSKLVKAGLEYALANNLKVQSLCWFVDGYINRHPEYQNLRQG
jgi:predicted GNAT family acetyltransferase